jgi:hypothetical protein
MAFGELRAARWVIQLGRLQWALMVAAAAWLLLSALFLWSGWGLLLSGAVSAAATGWGALIRGFERHSPIAWWCLVGLEVAGLGWAAAGWALGEPAGVRDLLLVVEGVVFLPLALHRDSRDWVAADAAGGSGAGSRSGAGAVGEGGPWRR